VKRTFSVTALVSSLNKTAKPEYELVRAEDEEEAARQAVLKIQKRNPHGHVTLGRVRGRQRSGEGKETS
jgi:hypothetical protein